MERADFQSSPQSKKYYALYCPETGPLQLILDDKGALAARDPQNSPSVPQAPQLRATPMLSSAGLYIPAFACKQKRHDGHRPSYFELIAMAQGFAAS
jgi:hypothetical protein